MTRKEFADKILSKIREHIRFTNLNVSWDEDRTPIQRVELFHIFRGPFSWSLLVHPDEEDDDLDRRIGHALQHVEG